MKKIVCTVLAVILLVSFASISFADSSSDEWKFERKVTIICPWGFGGGADSTIRPMAELLKPIIGQEVEVINITGGSGLIAADYAYKQPSDGYTFILGTQSLFILDIQHALSMNFKENFIPVARLVHATNIIAASKRFMDRNGFKTFSDIMKYIKEHPYRVKAGMFTSTGVDGISLKETLKGLSVLDIDYSSGAEMNAQLVGGNIDLVVTGTSEIKGLLATGEAVPVLALSEKRMKRYPEVECSVELGINSILGPARGIFAKKGTPQEAINAFSDAIEKASHDPKWQEFLVEGSYDEREGFAGSAEYAIDCEKDYKLLSGYLNSEGGMNTEMKDY